MTYVQLLTPEDSTLEKSTLSQEARWSYYVTAYTMRDPTEGVPFSQMRMPFLKRNLPSKLDEEEEYNRFFRPLVHHDGLIIRICANSYHILYEPNTHDWWWRPSRSAGDVGDAHEDEAVGEADKEMVSVKERRRARFQDKFVNHPSWARGLDKSEVDEWNSRFRSWIKGGDEDEPTVSAGAGAGAGVAIGAGAIVTAPDSSAVQEAPPSAQAQAEAAHKTEMEDADMADADTGAQDTAAVSGEQDEVQV